MVLFISKILSVIDSFFILLLNVGVTVIFVVIPTALLNPLSQIKYIEEYSCIVFPENYTVTDKYADWFGFEESHEIMFKFDKDNFSKLITSINNKCENGFWTESQDRFDFKFDTKFLDNKHALESTIFKETQTLQYKYIGK